MLYLGREWKLVEQGLACRLPCTYVPAILEAMRMKDCKPVSTPFAVKVAEHELETLSPAQASIVRAMVGRLLWMTPERPDIAYAVKEIARTVSAPTRSSWEALKRLLRYLSGTSMAGIVYKMKLGDQDLMIIAMADANWATSDGKSITGGAIYAGSCLIHHLCRTQATIALSSCEAELLALNSVASEGKMVQRILAEMQPDPDTEVKLMLCTDSTSAIAAVDRLGFGKRLRHMQVKQFWLQEEVRAGRLTIERVTSADNVADLFTKANPRAIFERHVQAIGMQMTW